MFNFDKYLLNKIILKTAIYRLEHFSSAHRLHNESWSDEKNNEIFGKCNNPNFHGHNYEIEVCVIGACDPETGYVIDTKILSKIIKEELLDRFDHKNLNLDVVEFNHLNPTTENLAKVSYELLRKKIDNKFELKIKLYETRKNYVEYPVY